MKENKFPDCWWHECGITKYVGKGVGRTGAEWKWGQVWYFDAMPF